MKCMLQMCGSRNYPYYPHRRSLVIPRGRGDLKAKLLEGQYEAKLEFPGVCRGTKRKTFHWGSMDIFWNYTMEECRLQTSSKYLGTRLGLNSANLGLTNLFKVILVLTVQSALYSPLCLLSFSVVFILTREALSSKPSHLISPDSSLLGKKRR